MYIIYILIYRDDHRVQEMNLSLKYLKNNNGSWYYQRRWPRALEDHPQIKTKQYSKPLGVSPYADESTLTAAWTRIHSVFEDYVSLLLLVNTDAISAKREEKLANALLEANGLKAGIFSPSPLLTDQQNDALISDAHHHVDSLGLFDDRERARSSPQLNVLDRAWKMLSVPPDSNARSILMLSDCWEAYQSHKDLDPVSRSAKKPLARWRKFVELVGDQVVTQEFINISLRTYAEQRRGFVKPSSVERELKTICPILRAGIETYDLPIVVKKPRIAGSTDFTERYVFTPSEQVELLAVIADKTLRSYAPWKEAAILLMLQTGCNTSEIQRLRCKNVHLEDDVPYIVIAGKTKTKERERVLPIVVEVERLKELLDNLRDDSGIALGGEVAKKDESNLSHQFKTVLKKVNPEATAYSLRHAMKNNALAAGVDSAMTALIGGWSSQLGVNPIQQQYGSAGRLYPKTLERLQKAMIRINSHMIQPSKDNVVQLRRG